MDKKNPIIDKAQANEIKSVTPPELFRLDKNIAHNIRDFRAFDEDKQIIKALITYFAYNLQTDLFGYGILDPASFGKKMGFSTNWLRSKHPNPACLKDMSKKEVAKTYHNQEAFPNHKEYRIFDSILENALYILRYNRIRYTSSASSFQKDGEHLTKISLDEVQFLSELSIVFRRTKAGRTKIVYTYRLADSFINNISNYYLKSNTESLKVLRKPSLDELYLYLKNLMTTFAVKGLIREFSNFKLLCDLAYISDAEPKHRKKRLTQAFVKIASQTELNVALNWHKNGARYAYTPEIEFQQEDISNMKESSTINTERQKILLHNINYELTKAYRGHVMVNDMGQTIDPDDLLRWLKQKKSNELSIYLDLAVINTFKELPDWHWNTRKIFFDSLKTAKVLGDVLNFKLCPGQ